MELEAAVIEAIKLKLEDTFKKVQVKSSIEGREIVIRISIPAEIMQIKPGLSIARMEAINRADLLKFNARDTSPLTDLDIEAQEAANDLLGPHD